ncbi:hypothetical protein SAMN05421677_1259 [Halobacillus aidingensis]|uniref:ATP synthase F0 subunit 8 n=1 Tax=Halobacillus aidingensis TaxID=240303 RepID=A0A1H0UA70_HALAD|nr:hypothetical protein SAMN05421677_1259 [Halobacillus aidingensis]
MTFPLFSILFLLFVLITSFLLLRFAKKPIRSRYMEQKWTPWIKKHMEKE